MLDKTSKMYPEAYNKVKDVSHVCKWDCTSTTGGSISPALLKGREEALPTAKLEQWPYKKKFQARGKAVPDTGLCAACGACEAVCPRGAIKVWRGSCSVVDESLCVGCGLCARECPASVIVIKERI